MSGGMFVGMTDDGQLDPVARSLFFALCFEAGIVPTLPRDSVAKTLAQMSLEDARTAKRKFRKLWKKRVRHAEREFGKNSKTARDMRIDYGAQEPGCVPHKRHKSRRKQGVFVEIASRVDEILRAAVPE